MSHAAGDHFGLVREKTGQAVECLRELGLDAWLLMGRETGELADPSLALVVGTTVTWTSFFLITASGERTAIVGTYDGPNLEGTGNFDRVLTYVGSPREALVEALGQAAPRSIAINVSASDAVADGLTHGLYRKLVEYLDGTPYAERLVPSDQLVGLVRGRKSPGEIERIRGAVATTLDIFAQVGEYVEAGQTEVEVYRFIKRLVQTAGVEPAWDRDYCPTVHAGDRPLGHTTAGEYRTRPGTVLHLDFGVKQQAYCSDLQRVWYLRRPGESGPPAEVQRAFETVTRAIRVGAAALKPGVAGWEVDLAARQVIVEAGYPEYLHAFGHQMGRWVHDGGGLLGPRWERYGDTPLRPVHVGNVFTLELGVVVPNVGYVAVEEDVVVTETGVEWLAPPQTELIVVG